MFWFEIGQAADLQTHTHTHTHTEFNVCISVKGKSLRCFGATLTFFLKTWWLGEEKMREEERRGLAF